MAAEEDAEPAVEDTGPEKPEAAETLDLPQTGDDGIAFPADDTEGAAEECWQHEPEPVAEAAGEQTEETAAPATDDGGASAGCPGAAGGEEAPPGREEAQAA